MSHPSVPVFSFEVRIYQTPETRNLPRDLDVQRRRDNTLKPTTSSQQLIKLAISSLPLYAQEIVLVIDRCLTLFSKPCERLRCDQVVRLCGASDPLVACAGRSSSVMLRQRVHHLSTTVVYKQHLLVRSFHALRLPIIAYMTSNKNTCTCTREMRRLSRVGVGVEAQAFGSLHTVIDRADRGHDDVAIYQY